MSETTSFIYRTPKISAAHVIGTAKASFWFLCLADAVTTFYALQNGGFEANPYAVPWVADGFGGMLALQGVLVLAMLGVEDMVRRLPYGSVAIFEIYAIGALVKIGPVLGNLEIAL